LKKRIAISSNNLEIELTQLIGSENIISEDTYKKIGLSVNPPKFPPNILDKVKIMIEKNHQPVVVYDDGLSLIELNNQIKAYIEQYKIEDIREESLQNTWTNQAFAKQKGPKQWLVIPTSCEGVHPESIYTYNSECFWDDHFYKPAFVRESVTIAILIKLEKEIKLFSNIYGRVKDKGPTESPNVCIGEHSDDGIRISSYDDGVVGGFIAMDLGDIAVVNLT